MTRADVETFRQTTRSMTSCARQVLAAFQQRRTRRAAMANAAAMESIEELSVTIIAFSDAAEKVAQELLARMSEPDAGDTLLGGDDGGGMLRE